MFEALGAEPQGDVERAGSVVAEDDDGLVGVELLVGTGGDVAHGHKEGSADGRGFDLPGLADVEEEGRIGLFELLGEGIDGDLWREHRKRITNLDGIGRTLRSLAWYFDRRIVG